MIKLLFVRQWCWCVVWALVFAYPAQALDGDIAYLAVDENGYWQIWLINADGGKPHRITQTPYDKNNLSWFPDGKRLLVNGNQGELVEVAIESGKETPIELPYQRFTDAALSPDGKKVVFSLSTSESQDDNNIWVVGLDGKNPRKLTNLPDLQHEPRWSRDGKIVYFLSGKDDDNHDIWSLNVADGSKRQLTFNSRYHFDVATAKDGRLAYSGNRSGNYEIWIWPPGQKPYPVTDHPALDAGPAWSPDGRKLVFQSARGGVANLWLLDLSDREPVQLTHHKAGARKPVWRDQEQGL